MSVMGRKRTLDRSHGGIPGRHPCETVHRNSAPGTDAWIRRLASLEVQSPRNDWRPESRRTAPFFSEQKQRLKVSECGWRSKFESNQRDRFHYPPESSESLFTRVKSSPAYWNVTMCALVGKRTLGATGIDAYLLFPPFEVSVRFAKPDRPELWNKFGLGDETAESTDSW